MDVLAKFRLEPLRFFGALGGLIFTSGVVLTGLTVGQKFFSDGALYKSLYQRPLFLIGILLVVLGVQIVGFVLVVEVVRVASTFARSNK